MTKPQYDLCVIGGGINGAGIARDAQGRGLKTLLVEMDDLASHTSSASSKLIHGGLRYLEYYEFHLVAEALKEREILLGIAPQLVHPLELCLPHDAHLRPAWMIRAGLFLYDHLAGRRKLTKSRGITFDNHPYGQPLQKKYARGFAYSDCWVDDSRLVVLNALDAAERGATVLTRTACINAQAENGVWRLALSNGRSHTAARLINAAGPWVHKVLTSSGLADATTPNIRLVKGSHIVIPRLYDGPQAYILQEDDRRIVFVIPYQLAYTMVGTTDVAFTGDPAQVSIDPSEIDYLCAAVNQSFNTQITPADIKATWSGVRPLLDDGRANASAVTRDYKLVTDYRHGAPLLSVFGGKITTYRKLAEQALDQLCGGKRWTHKTPLPGGDIANFQDFLDDARNRYATFPPGLIIRYAYAYGTRMHTLLDGKLSPADLGANYGGDLYEAEVRYLVRTEWARSAEDILHRRTKLYLHTGAETAHALEAALPQIVREEVLGN